MKHLCAGTIILRLLAGRTRQHTNVDTLKSSSSETLPLCRYAQFQPLTAPAQFLEA